MSAPTIPTCSLGLTPDDLSAWRDHTLSPANEQRIADHINGCAACQRIIAAHDALADALRAEQPPAPDPRNWPRLQARISGVRQPLSARSTLRRTQRPAVWGGLSAAAAVLLLSALFFHLFSQQAGLRGGSSHAATATATPVVTPQPIPTGVAPTAPIAGTPLMWRTREGPSDLIPMSSAGDLIHSNEIAFSPTNAHTAYACSMTRTNAAVLDVWATHDGAQSWTHVNETAYDLKWYGCVLNVDAGDPMRVEITLTTLYGGQASTSRTLLSDDGGRTWRQITDAQMLTNLVTQGNASIAIIRQWPPLLSPETHLTAQELNRLEQIVVSHDDWRTWQSIDGDLRAQGLFAKDVWQRPGDGALLASVTSYVGQVNPADDAQLWQSVDLGAHWTRIPTPTNLRADGGFMVGPPQANVPWHACGIMAVGKEVNKPTTLVACTLDSGQTWQTRPMPVFPTLCGNYCSVGEEINQPAMLPDGSLLAAFGARVTASGAEQNYSGGDLYLLTPHATHWQDIGSLRSGTIIVIGASTATLVGLPNGTSMQVATDETGEPRGVFTSNNPLGDAHALAVATLP